MQHGRPALSICLPAHNEEQNVAAMAAQLTQLAAPLGEFEIVFIDDCSTDGTLAELKRLAARDPRIRFITFTRNFGYHAAQRAGLKFARGDAVILMDCDFEHPPELVPQLVEKWRAGSKVVVTQRNTLPEQATAFKRLTSQAFYRIFNALGDVQIEPGGADFMLLDRSVVELLAPFEDQELFLRGFVRWLGVPWTTLPYTQGARHTGQTKFTLRRMLDFASMGIISHSIRPLRIALYLSFAFALIAALLFIYSIVSFLWVGGTVAGWTSVIAAIAILGAGQFLVLGIIGEYVGRLIRQTRGWPLYLVAETSEADAATATTAAAPKRTSGGA